MFAYKQPPTLDFPIEKVVELAGLRLRMLKELESKTTLEAFELDEALDQVSHFMLVLAVAGDRERESWLQAKERGLLKWKFRHFKNKKQVIQEFFFKVGLAIRPLDPGLFEAQKERLQIQRNSLVDDYNRRFLRMKKKKKVQLHEFYMTEWTNCLSLVANNSCLLVQGTAIVEEDSILPIVLQKTTELVKDNIARGIKIKEESGKMNHILEWIDVSEMDREEAEGVAIQALSELKDMSRTFPLCMKNMYDHLEEHHHLKHQGRMQLGLYLKELGLTMEQSLKYWRGHFMQVMNDKEFKEHEYRVKHMYGREGGGTSYSGYSCNKIISSKPGPSDVHGCPYASMDGFSLFELVLKSGASKEIASQALNLSQAGKYMEACALVAGKNEIPGKPWISDK